MQPSAVKLAAAHEATAGYSFVRPAFPVASLAARFGSRLASSVVLLAGEGTLFAAFAAGQVWLCPASTARREV